LENIFQKRTAELIGKRDYQNCRKRRYFSYSASFEYRDKPNYDISDIPMFYVGDKRKKFIERRIGH